MFSTLGNPAQPAGSSRAERRQLNHAMIEIGTTTGSLQLLISMSSVCWRAVSK
jgi:hypothetical protein